MSRTVSFTSDVIESGPIDEGSGGMTSWMVTEPLDAALWYWQVWVSDGIEQTRPAYGRFSIGTTTSPDAGIAPRDAGMIERPDGGFVLGLDGGSGVSDSGCACSLAASQSRSRVPPLGLLVVGGALATSSLCRRRARRRAA